MSSWDKEWAMCYSGRRVFPFDLKKSDIDIIDIAHQLGMQCRYNGAVSRFYSVGEHCIRIADALFRDTGDARLALKGLLHDAGEAYTGDFTRPVKNSMREVGEILHAAEDRNEHTIFSAFGVADYDDHGKIKEYDRRIIVDEKTALFGPNKPWDWDLVALDVPIIGWARNCVVLVPPFAGETDQETHLAYADWSPDRVGAEYTDRFYTYSRKALHS